MSRAELDLFDLFPDLPWARISGTSILAIPRRRFPPPRQTHRAMLSAQHQASTRAINALSEIRARAQQHYDRLSPRDRRQKFGAVLKDIIRVSSLYANA